MSEPHLRESGPGYRIWDMPDGTHYEQRAEAVQQFTRINLRTPDRVKAAMEEQLLDEVSSRAAKNTDEPLIRTEFEGWKEQELIGDDGFVWGKCLEGRATTYYWPSLPAEDAA